MTSLCIRSIVNLFFNLVRRSFCIGKAGNLGKQSSKHSLYKLNSDHHSPNQAVHKQKETDSVLAAHKGKRIPLCKQLQDIRHPAIWLAYYWQDISSYPASGKTRSWLSNYLISKFKTVILLILFTSSAIISYTTRVHRIRQNSSNDLAILWQIK